MQGHALKALLNAHEGKILPSIFQEDHNKGLSNRVYDDAPLTKAPAKNTRPLEVLEESSDQPYSKLPYHVINSISRRLTGLLRHDDKTKKLTQGTDGFALIDDLLTHKRVKSLCINIQIRDIQEIVRVNNKQRLTLRQNAENKQVMRANQGHTMTHIC